MQYSPGTIIKYKEEIGFKRTLYGIVLEQLNENCVNIISELKNERIISLFLNSKISSEYVTIEKILDSYKEIPENNEQGHLSLDRLVLKQIGRLLDITSKR